MSALASPQRIGAVFLALSGILHILPGVLAGAGLALIVVGVVYLLMAEGLRRGWRWLAYIAFFMTLFGAVLAYSTIGSDLLLPDPYSLPVMLADLGCAVSLFIALWPSRTAQA